MSHETAPSEAPEDLQPLDLTSDELPESKIGRGIIGFTESFNDRTLAAAERIDNLTRRSIKARQDAGEWISGTVEQAKERTKGVFKRIGRGALNAAKAAGKGIAYVPLTGIGLGIMAGEAVGTALVTTKNAAVESVNRTVERGKDGLANTRDKVGISLGNLSLSNLEAGLAFENAAVAEAVRKREAAEAKERRAIAERDAVQSARDMRIAKADEARARIEARRAKWARPEIPSDDTEVA